MFFGKGGGLIILCTLHYLTLGRRTSAQVQLDLKQHLLVLVFVDVVDHLKTTDIGISGGSDGLLT